MLAGCDLRPVDGADGDRYRLGHRRDGAVVGSDREDLLLADAQVLLQAAVEVDPDQREVVAGVGAADAARVAVPAGVQRIQRDARPTRARGGRPAPRAAIVPPTSCPWMRGNGDPPAASESSPSRKW